MGHAKLKTSISVASLFTWIFLLFLVKYLKTTFNLDELRFQETIRILLLYFNIPILFIWLLSSAAFAFPATLLTSLFIAISFKNGIFIFPVISFTVTSFVGYRLNASLAVEKKRLEVDMEKSYMEFNVLKDAIVSAEKDNLRMRDSLKKITYLKNVIEDYGQTLSEEEILDSITKDTFELFSEADRVLLYLVDTEKQELALARSKKKTGGAVKAKKGDIFDRWILKHRMPLLVGDTQNDFRFSVKEKLDEGSASIISMPLTSEQKIIGVLRIGSAVRRKFTQSDLRLLNIVADLSSISLQNAALYKKVQNLALHDGLTGLYVHNYFVERLTQESKRSEQSGKDFSVLTLDLDHFKAYNDAYGHNAGDLALKRVSSILESFARPDDILCRYGGEEFALLLLDSKKDAAYEIAENIRKKVNQTPLVLRQEKTKITVSIGIAACPSEKKTHEELLTLADSRLYRAKQKGRNRVCAK
ncbi:MAG: diguanylate cyclase [Candidatus Omnitrophica bacterium]|nr:diguanylate cyclase [Candidatus Omnitrophota bacterium]